MLCYQPQGPWKGAHRRLCLAQDAKKRNDLQHLAAHGLPPTADVGTPGAPVLEKTVDLISDAGDQHLRTSATAHKRPAPGTAQTEAQASAPPVDYRVEIFTSSAAPANTGPMDLSSAAVVRAHQMVRNTCIREVCI